MYANGGSVYHIEVGCNNFAIWIYRLACEVWSDAEMLRYRFTSIINLLGAFRTQSVPGIPSTLLINI